MTGKILVVDPIATNRIILKAKLSATFYEVETASDATRALKIARTLCPDLIVIQGPPPDATMAGLVTDFRTGPCPDAPLLCIGAPDPAAVLNTGADDALPAHLPNPVLLARIRAALRDHAARVALASRLGADPSDSLPLHGQAAIGLVTTRTAQMLKWQAGLAANGCGRIDLLAPDSILGRADGAPRHDVHVIDGDLGRAGTGLGMLSDLRARPHSREAQAIMILPDADDQAIAAAYDLGAGAVLTCDVPVAELAARARALARRKRQTDRLQEALDAGLALAHIDPLTGLQNRRAAMDALEQTRAATTPMAVIMIDIDHFKRVNDAHGHAAGDAVLVSVARQLRRSLPQATLLARIGGEEFLATHPVRNASDAVALSNQMRRDIAGLAITPDPARNPISVTLSAGVVLARPDLSPSRLLSDADEGLYRAKRAGRNRVELVHTTPVA